MSNVRPRFKPRHETRSLVHCAAQAREQDKGCRRRLEPCAPAQGWSRGRCGLSVLRRPAHGRAIAEGGTPRMRVASVAFEQEARFKCRPLLVPQALHALRVCSRPQPSLARAVRPSAASARPCHYGMAARRECGWRRRLRAKSEVQMQAAASGLLQNRPSCAVAQHQSALPAQAQAYTNTRTRRRRRRPYGARCRRWYASACKHKALVRLAERGLTLPSRGQLPAYGLQLPLMSNVRPHKCKLARRLWLIRLAARHQAVRIQDGQNDPRKWMEADHG